MEPCLQLPALEVPDGPLYLSRCWCAEGSSNHLPKEPAFSSHLPKEPAFRSHLPKEPTFSSHLPTEPALRLTLWLPWPGYQTTGLVSATDCGALAFSIWGSTQVPCNAGPQLELEARQLPGRFQSTASSRWAALGDCDRWKGSYDACPSSLCPQTLLRTSRHMNITNMGGRMTPLGDFGRRHGTTRMMSSASTLHQACLAPSSTHRVLCTLVSTVFACSAQALVTVTYLLGAAHASDPCATPFWPLALLRLLSHTAFPPCSLRRYRRRVRYTILMHTCLALSAILFPIFLEVSPTQFALAMSACALASGCRRLLAPLSRNGQLGWHLNHCLRGGHPLRCCTAFGALLSFASQGGLPLTTIYVCLTVMWPPHPDVVVPRRGVLLMALEQKGKEWPKYLASHTRRRVAYNIRCRATIPNILRGTCWLLSNRLSASPPNQGPNRSSATPTTPSQNTPFPSPCPGQAHPTRTPAPLRTSPSRLSEHSGTPASPSPRGSSQATAAQDAGQSGDSHTQASSLTSTGNEPRTPPTTNAHAYQKGDHVLYCNQDGSWTPVEIAEVHHEVFPPTYSVLLPTGERNTEGRKLRPIGSDGSGATRTFEPQRATDSGSISEPHLPKGKAIPTLTSVTGGGQTSRKAAQAACPHSRPARGAALPPRHLRRSTPDNLASDTRSVSGQDWYVEAQSGGNCLVHAFNNALGARVVSSKALMQYCNQHHPGAPDYANGGWFDLQYVFKYLDSFDESTITPLSIAVRDPAARLSSKLLADELVHHGFRTAERMIAHISGAVSNQATADTPGHFVALRWHTTSRTWYLIDSIGNLCSPLDRTPHPPQIDQITILSERTADEFIVPLTECRLQQQPGLLTFRGTAGHSQSPDNTASSAVGVGNETWYLEQQVQAFCLAHAFNNAVGARIVSAQDLLAFRNFLSGSRSPGSEEGWFSSSLLISYLTGHDSCFTLWGPNFNRSISLTPPVLQSVLEEQGCPQADRLILHIPGHFIALRRHNTLGTWHVLDSFHPNECRPLTTVEEVDGIHILKLREPPLYQAMAATNEYLAQHGHLLSPLRGHPPHALRPDSQNPRRLAPRQPLWTMDLATDDAPLCPESSMHAHPRQVAQRGVRKRQKRQHGPALAQATRNCGHLPARPARGTPRTQPPHHARDPARGRTPINPHEPKKKKTNHSTRLGECEGDQVTPPAPAPHHHLSHLPEGQSRRKLKRPRSTGSKQQTTLDQFLRPSHLANPKEPKSDPHKLPASSAVPTNTVHNTKPTVAPTAIETNWGPLPKLTITCVNTQGWISKVGDLQLCSRIQKSDILVCTEVKLTNSRAHTRLIRTALPDHHRFTSFSTRASPAGGVVVAISKRLLHRGVTASHPHVPNVLKGHVCHVVLHHPDGLTHILGVYSPTDDTETRRHIEQYISRQIRNAKNATPPAPPQKFVAAGDWNAVMNKSHRSSHQLYTHDSHHIRFIQDLGLTPCLNRSLAQDAASPSPIPTWQNGVTQWSCIDEIFIHPSPPRMHLTSAYTPGFDTDHQLVESKVPYPTLGIPIPPLHSQGPETPFQESTRVLQGPFSSADLLALQDWVAHHLPEEFAEFHSDCLGLLQGMGLDPKNPAASNPHQDPARYQATVDALASTLGSIYERVYSEALNIMGKVRPAQVNQRRTFLPKQMKAKRRKALLALNAMRSLRFKATTGKLDVTWAETHPHLPEDAKHAACSMATGTISREEFDKKTAPCLQQCKYSFQEVKQDIAKRNATRRMRRLTRLFYSAPKKAHRMIFQSGPSNQLEAIRLSDGSVSYDPTHILKGVHSFFQKAWGSPSGLPANSPPPWANVRHDPGLGYGGYKLDRGQIQYDVPHPEKALWPCFCDPQTFAQALKSLSSNKAPGPDRIPNEILKHLPASALEAIQTYMHVLWATGCTPSQWKDSDTILLHKKDDPCDVANFRPIGLAITTYKLWTTMVTITLDRYASTNRLLYDLQEGFQREKSTIRQVQRLKSLIHDASTSQQNLLVAYIDFSSAFNTVSHAHLLTTMEWMQFPPDARAAIAGIYSGVKTRIRTPAGTTEDITIRQGTIQGDALSPLIFLLCMDPLLRWLQMGGRGYHPACTKAEFPHLSLAALAYADDIAILTSTPADLAIQIKKLELFCKWAGLHVNVKKCEVSGALHNDVKNRLARTAYCKDRLLARIGSQAYYGGQPIPILDPKKPFRYLGVHVSMDNSSSAQVQASRSKLEVALPALVRAPLTIPQKLKILETCVLPSAAYGLETCQIGETDLKSLDSIIFSHVKRILRLPKCAPNAPLCIPRGWLGLGIPTISRSFLSAKAAHLVKCLNAPDTLGVILRGQLARAASATGLRGPRTHVSAEWSAFGDLPLIQDLATLTRAHLYINFQIANQDHRQNIALDTVTTTATAQSLHSQTDLTDRALYGQIYRALVRLFRLNIRCAGDALSGTVVDGFPMLKHASQLRYTGITPTPAEYEAYNLLSKLLSGTHGQSKSTDDTVHRKVLPSILDRLPPNFADTTRSNPVILPPPRPLPNVLASTDPTCPREHGTRPIQARQTRTTDLPETAVQSPSSSPPRKLLKGYKPAQARLIKEAERQVTKPAPHGALERASNALYRKLRSEAEQLGEDLARWAAWWFSISDEDYDFKILTARQWNIRPRSRKRSSYTSTQFLVQWSPIPCPEIIVPDVISFWEKWGYVVEQVTAASFDPLPAVLDDMVNNLCVIPLSKAHAWIPHLRLIHFVPSWHKSSELFEDSEEEERQRTIYLERHTRDVENRPPLETTPKDHHLAPEQRSYPQCRAAPTCLPLNRTIRNCLTVDTADHWPDEDCPPTGHLELYALDAANKSDWKLCDAAGHPLGYGSERCLSRIWQHCAQHTPPDRLLEVVKANLSATLYRYRHTRLDNTKSPETSSPRLYWGQLSPPLLEAIARVTGYRAHHLATPLSHLWPHASYTTPLSEDTHVGSAGQSYTYQWTGTSLVTPPPDATAIHKAMRWALASCQRDPTAVIYLALPRKMPLCGAAGVLTEEVAYVPKDLHPYSLPPSYGMPQRILKEPHLPCTLVRIHHNSRIPSSLPAPASICSALEQALSPSMSSAHHPAIRPGSDPIQPTSLQVPAKFNEGTPFHAVPPIPPVLTPTAFLQPAPPPLQDHDSDILFTDGSRRNIQTPEGLRPRSGACVYDASTDVKHLVQPGAHSGYHATVNRAELCAIYAAVGLVAPTDRNVTIYCDSKTSLQQIQGYASDPRPHKFHPERKLLSAIHQSIVLRSEHGAQTCLHKVRAHAGIIGNVWADEGACLAAASGEGALIDIGLNDAPGDYWIGTLPEHPESILHPALAVSAMATYPEAFGPPSPNLPDSHSGKASGRNLRNLTSDLRREALLNAPTSLSNPSIYGDAMCTARDCRLRADDLLVDGKYSDAQIRSAFKFRVGHIHNRKHEYRYSGLPGIPLCPLCGQPDSGSHIMLACHHRDMRKLHIERHNKAVRILANAMLKGQYACSFHTVDGGSVSRLDTLEHQHVASRTPYFLTNTRGAVERRPDVLQVTGMTWEEADRHRKRRMPVDPPREPNSSRTVNIVEVGYAVDTRLPAKAAEKRLQHSSLEQDLLNRGWDVHVYPIALGASGALQNTLPKTMWDLGIRGQAAEKALSGLQRNAVYYCHALHVKRRCLERGPDSQTAPRLFSGGGYTGHGPPGSRGG